MSEPKPKKKPDGYVKYTGIAFQLFGIVLFSYLVGTWLDGYFETEQPYITAGLTLFMIVTYLWKIVIEINNQIDK